MNLKDWTWPLVALVLAIIITGSIIFIVQSLKPEPGSDMSLPNADQMQTPPIQYSTTGHDVKG